MLRLLCGPMDVPEAMARFKSFRLAIPLPNAAMVTLHLSTRGDRIGPVEIGHVPPAWRTT